MRSYRRKALDQQVPPCLRLPSGKVIFPQPFYSLVDASDSFGGISKSCTASDGLQHAVTINQRGGGICPWTVQDVASGFLVTTDIANGVAMGRGIGNITEAWVERLGSSDQVIWNPTFEGAGNWPPSDTDDPKERMTKLYPSVVRHVKVEQPNAAQLVLESGVVPMDFDAIGLEDPAKNKGGDPDVPLLMWTMRMFRRLELNNPFPGVHRLSYASYLPIDLPPAPTQGLMSCQMLSTCHFMPWFRNLAEWYDPRRDLATALPNWSSAVINGTWIIDRPQGLAIDNTLATTPYPAVGREVAGIYTADALNLAVGMFAGLDLKTSDGTRRLTQIVATKGNDSFPPNIRGQATQAFFAFAKDPESGFSGGRPAGWLFQSHFLVTAVGATNTLARAKARSLCQRLLNENALAYRFDIADIPLALTFDL